MNYLLLFLLKRIPLFPFQSKRCLCQLVKEGLNFRGNYSKSNRLKISSANTFCFLLYKKRRKSAKHRMNQLGNGCYHRYQSTQIDKEQVASIFIAIECNFGLNFRHVVDFNLYACGTVEFVISICGCVTHES